MFYIELHVKLRQDRGKDSSKGMIMFNDIPIAVSEDKILAGLEQDIIAAEDALQHYKKEQSEIDKEFQKTQRRIETLNFQIKEAAIGETQNLLQKLRNDILNALPAEQSLRIKIEDVRAAITADNIDEATRFDLTSHLIVLKGRLTQALSSYTIKEQELLDNIACCKNKRAIHIAKVYVATIRQQFIEKFNDMHIGWQNIDTDADFSAEIENSFKKYRPYYDDIINKKLVVSFINNAISIVQKYQDSFDIAVSEFVKNISNDDLCDATELEINNIMERKMADLFSHAEDRINQECVSAIYNLKGQVLQDIGTKYFAAKISKCDEFLVLLDKHLTAFSIQQTSLKSDLRLIQNIKNEQACFLRKRELYTEIAMLNLERFDALYKKLKLCTIYLNKLYKSRKSSYMTAIGLELILAEETSDENIKIAKLALEICRLEIKQQESKFLTYREQLKMEHAQNEKLETVGEKSIASKMAYFTSQIFDMRVSYFEKLRGLHKNISAMFKFEHEHEPNNLSGEKITGLIVAKLSGFKYLECLKEYYALYMTIATKKPDVIDTKTNSKIILLHLQIYSSYYKSEIVGHTNIDISIIEELDAALEAYEEFHNKTYKESKSDINKSDCLPSLAALLQIARLLHTLPKHPILHDFDNYLEKIIHEVKSKNNKTYSDWRSEDYDGTAHESDEDVDVREEYIEDSDDAYSIDEIDQEQTNDLNEIYAENTEMFDYENDKSTTPLLPVPDTPTSIDETDEVAHSENNYETDMRATATLSAPNALISTELQTDETETITLESEQLVHLSSLSSPRATL